MEASIAKAQLSSPRFEPDVEKIKRRLLKHGVHPTPKIVHTLRKKEIQKHNRKANRLAQKEPPPLTDAQKQEIAEETHFLALKREYRDFTRAVKSQTCDPAKDLMVGMPWERLEKAELRELAIKSQEFLGERLKREELRELREVFEERKRDTLKWVLDDDVELEQDWVESDERSWDPGRRRRSETDSIKFLVERLSETQLTSKDWKFSWMMKKSELQFTEVQLLKIVGGLGDNGRWKQALSVVEWIYADKRQKHFKSRFVYTKLLSVLGKARRPREALQIFNLMLGDYYIYPDLAAYHSIAVTLGQAGHLKKLVNIIECMRSKPSKLTKIMGRRNWDPTLEPDVVVYNAVLNACVPSKQWKGVSWVFQELRKNGLKPTEASYGLAMEVMLKSGRYDLVHEFFGKMRRSGETPKALTYKVLVRAFWEEGKVDEALGAVRDMERRGVVGTATVYYELACCLCKSGRWEDAMVEVVKMKNLRYSQPLEVAFTGMIKCSMEAGHIDDCTSIFEHMKAHCSPNIGTINVMLKVCGRNDMFSKAKELFEGIKIHRLDPNSSMDKGAIALTPDMYTYSAMLEASAAALQWEYFEYVYKEMTLAGYQINHNKHAYLLVEASRAGKWHLLEHAFDAILENGEIPHPSYFSEMVLEATAQENYERAVILVNSMAHAPFCIDEKQWTCLFKKNEDRISEDSLKQLLDALHNCEAASEPSVLNLLRSLHSLYESDSSKDYTTFAAFGSESADMSFLVDDEADIGGKRLNASADTLDGKNSLSGISDAFDTAKAESADNYSAEKACDEEGDNSTDDVLACESSDVDNLISSFSLDQSSSDEDEMYSDIEDSDHDGSKVPSAYEILKGWQGNRKRRDGIFFPYKLRD